jgi:hypothetical protein
MRLDHRDLQLHFGQLRYSKHLFFRQQTILQMAIANPERCPTSSPNAIDLQHLPKTLNDLLLLVNTSRPAHLHSLQIGQMVEIYDLPNQDFQESSCF